LEALSHCASFKLEGAIRNWKYFTICNEGLARDIKALGLWEEEGGARSALLSKEGPCILDT
jgi:hypothetical protein